MSQCQFLTPSHQPCPSSAHPKSLKEEIEGGAKFCTHHQQVKLAQTYYNGKEETEKDGELEEA